MRVTSVSVVTVCAMGAKISDPLLVEDVAQPLVEEVVEEVGHNLYRVLDICKVQGVDFFFSSSSSASFSFSSSSSLSSFSARVI
jgi:hypothetical protein